MGGEKVRKQSRKEAFAELARRVSRNRHHLKRLRKGSLPTMPPPVEDADGVIDCVFECTPSDYMQCRGADDESNVDDFYASLVEAAVAGALDSMPADELHRWTDDRVMFVMLRHERGTDGCVCDAVALIQRGRLRAVLEAAPPDGTGMEVFDRTARALGPGQRWAFVMVRGDGCIVQSTVITTLSQAGMFGGTTVGQA